MLAWGPVGQGRRRGGPRVGRVSVLGGGESPFRDDDGSADPRAAAALAAFGAGLGSEHAALSALAGSRLLVPVVAVRSEPEGREEGAPRISRRPGLAGPGGGDHGSEMSLPTLVGHDGRSAIPVFTCVDALARWDAQARPVPAQAALVWRAAVDGSCAVVVDIAGPVPLAVDGARLAALADGRAVPRPHQDPDVLDAVRAAVAGQPAIAELRVADGDPAAAGDDLAAAGRAASAGPGEGCDLQIELTLAAGCSLAAGDEAARLLGRALMEQLGGRLRRGITIAVAGPGGHPGP